MYRISASLRGAIPIKAKETNRFADVDNILKKCNNKTKIVFWLILIIQLEHL